ncbi:MAG: substrate-binding domain-containing protein [Deinococcus sp.]|nr:substrate-binding domain-containing protein [Deinococcus sp.]
MLRLWKCLALLLGLGLSASAQVEERLILATTTSTENSGLLDFLLPPFEERFGIDVQVVAVGTGAALHLGETGDADVVMVHAPALEEAFVAGGFGVNRREFMFNDFVLLGPPDDPAGAAQATQVAAALAQIFHAQATFVSRGDNSGTHVKELELWRLAGLDPRANPNYRETGRGMGETLITASELGGYTLSDRGTFVTFADRVALAIVAQGPVTGGDSLLANPYSIIAVNPVRYPDINYLGAMALIAWVTSPQGQRLIRDYQVNGQPLFFPTLLPPE